MAESVYTEIEVAAPQATVFALLTDPDQIVRWIGTEANLDATPGGLFLVNVGGRHMARGEFTEVIPVHRLAYSFGWDDNETVPPGSSHVEIDLIARDAGTLIRFTHSGLPNAKERDSHRKGWEHYLSRLKIIADGGHVDPDVPMKNM
ncbi:SRPBCC family protein [Mesorhizobium sp.]|uniref:SRPBCC family protein n=1 Tax=Mesorhizobium sp. TaxID=1871066 RepID=UPI000FE4F7AA|nr:SRPBCC family protein [Mesorhizobium sp.]RWA65998.1 MAG: transcriptional regulator [Mesorhizobium sp.]RWA80826.1 MAG: transcriptional regulator [Mesorhizobium sp.]